MLDPCNWQDQKFADEKQSSRKLIDIARHQILKILDRTIFLMFSGPWFPYPVDYRAELTCGMFYHCNNQSRVKHLAEGA